MLLQAAQILMLGKLFILWKALFTVTHTTFSKQEMGIIYKRQMEEVETLLQTVQIRGIGKHLN